MDTLANPTTDVQSEEMKKVDVKMEMKKKKTEQLNKLKERIMKGTFTIHQIYYIANKVNSKAVELEAKRLNSDSYVCFLFLKSRYSKHEARKEWIESKEKERKDYKLRGIDDSN